MRRSDGFVIVADSLEKFERRFRAVVERARAAVERVPEETRAANLTDTVYLRPRPGAARMYPETDVPPFNRGQDLLERLRESLPGMPESSPRN